jgi:putative oxidoreductase
MVRGGRRRFAATARPPLTLSASLSHSLPTTGAGGFSGFARAAIEQALDASGVVQRRSGMANFVGHYEPRGEHWIATHAVDRIVALCGIVPYCLVAIILRLLVARDIFLAGQAKITGPALFGGAAMLPTHVHADILAAFARLFPTAPVSSGFLAHCFVIGEFILPICLVIGLGTRIASALLLIFAVLLEMYFVPGTAWTIHAYWGAVLLVLMSCGPGPVSLDWIVRTLYRGQPITG